MTGRSVLENKKSPNCLLCNSKQTAVRHSLSCGDIMKCWAIDGHHFTDAAMKSLLNEGMIHLYVCGQCGFHYFNPALAAGAKFYEELHAQCPGYYADNRPENERNVGFACRRGFRNILDIGCGPGFALDAAKRAGLQTYGIELSSTAAVEAERRGHTIFPVLLEDMDAIWEGKFDLISLNQLLEHVPDPVGLIKQCVRFLSPRGTIAIAVPGVDGILRFCPWLEANWPPHHISRWRIADFKTLAQQTGLRVIKTGGDELLGSAIEETLSGHCNRCRVLQKPYRGLSLKGIKLVSFMYRKLGLKYISPLYGQSLYCYLRQR